MSADIPDPNGIVARAEYIYDGCLVDEIEDVDLSDLQFEDNDNWLYIPSQCSTESAIHDLYAWLKMEPELNTQVNRKCINTRTFTRPKKRSARLSFESIFEGLPPSPSSDIWKPQSADVTQIHHAEKHLPITIEDKESVPPMLKPSTMTVTNNLSGETLVISGQESMEAFLNLSQSKGIDSFINLGEPEFNDLLMNVSQPSLMYTSLSSLMNDSTFMKNDTMQITNTYTVKRSSDVEGKSNSNSGNETFVMQSADNKITLDTAYCTNSLHNTFCKELVQPDLNETYNAEAPVEASAPWSNLNKEETSLSSTFVTEPNVDVNFARLQNEDIKPLDVTYLSSPKDAEGQNLTVSIESDAYKPTNTADLDTTCNVLSDNTEPAARLATRAGENVLNMSFKVPVCNQSTPMNPNMLNPTSKLAMKHSEQPRQTLYSTLKAPTSLRRELLAEIQRSGERKLDSTYTNIPSDHPGLRDTKENIHIACNENETDISPSNRYHTYRKSTLMTNQYRNQREAAMTAQKELPVDQRKFYTFTKKSNNLVRKTDLMTSNENAEMRPGLDSTFRKPLPPNAQKRNAPKTLSKLPQFLQKSNPNLVSSSLKTVGGVSVSRLSSVGYIKGSQPNIAENIAEKLPSKLHPYGKLRSGSEQRLVVDADANSQFPMKGMAAGSTESIESTQSAHSAPDLDDRLSTCSDSSSHNSCGKHTMDINQLHQLVRMQEESLKQDVMPKLNRRVLENTWIEEKTDLPSPILKNGVRHGETDRHSLNTDTSMKCSSPLESFTESSHALNNDGNPEANIAKSKSEVEKAESPNQIMPKNENKTRLKQPTNWNKPTTVMSGIPRPASRIPALRFARPSAKTEADLKKRPT